MKFFNIFLFFIIFSSCVPYKIAPKIEDYKITNAKSFKKGLPEQTAFIFSDPKKAYEFYDYIDARFGFKNQQLGKYLPAKINDKAYYFTFYEVERKTKTLNIAPIVADVATHNKMYQTNLQDYYTSRKGKWYIAITISDDKNADCLLNSIKEKENIIQFLKKMKNDYLNTTNYTETKMKFASN